MSEIKHGWYSARAAEHHGSHIYENADGKEIEVTQATVENHNPYEGGIYEEEAVYVGPVLTWRRVGIADKPWRGAP